jgi:hypothetical protein
MPRKVISGAALVPKCAVPALTQWRLWVAVRLALREPLAGPTPGTLSRQSGAVGASELLVSDDPVPTRIPRTPRSPGVEFSTIAIASRQQAAWWM